MFRKRKTEDNKDEKKPEPRDSLTSKVVGRRAKKWLAENKGDKAGTSKKTKGMDLMIGDPEYEEMLSKNSFKADGHVPTNPMKWLSNRKEKKQQEACRIEWQDFEIDRLKCENEILQVRDIKNEHEKDILKQEIFDYGNSLAISYVRLKSLYKELRVTYNSLKQVHEWVPEGEQDTDTGSNIHIPDLDDFGEDKAQLANLVRDVEVYVSKIKRYTEQLFQRSATKYFANRGSFRQSLDRPDNGKLSNARRSSMPDTMSVGYWLADFHNTDNKAPTENKPGPAKPWWKRPHISADDLGRDPLNGSNLDLSKPPESSSKQRLPARRSASLSPYEMRDLSSAMAMMAFSQEDMENAAGLSPGRRESRGGSPASHTMSTSDMLSASRMSAVDQTAQQLVRDMFSSYPKIVISDDFETRKYSNIEEERELMHSRQTSLDLKNKEIKLKRKSNKDLKKKETILNGKGIKDFQTELNKTSDKSLKNLKEESSHLVRERKAIQALEEIQRSESDSNKSDVQSQAKFDGYDADHMKRTQSKSVNVSGSPRGVSVKGEDVQGPRSQSDPVSRASVEDVKSDDLLKLLQQTEHEVHMLRNEREDLLNQLKDAQILLDILSQQVEEHKNEVARLKERCRKARLILG